MILLNIFIVTLIVLLLVLSICKLIDKDYFKKEEEMLGAKIALAINVLLAILFAGSMVINIVHCST